MSPPPTPGITSIEQFQRAYDTDIKHDRVGESVSSLENFIHILEATSVGLYVSMYLESNWKFFNDIGTTFAEVLQDVRDSDTFERLLRALPRFSVPGVQDLFSCLRRSDGDPQPPTEEQLYRDAIYPKWLEVWPVSALVLPSRFPTWLSGDLLGGSTPADDLKDMRQQALDTIYGRWLNDKDLLDQLVIRKCGLRAPDAATTGRSLVRYVTEAQFVPDQFWYWQNPDAQNWDAIRRGERPAKVDAALKNYREYIEKRKRVWRERIHPIWCGARGRITGITDYTFLSDWSMANITPPPSPPKEITTFEMFRRSRRGCIWA